VTADSLTTEERRRLDEVGRLRTIDALLDIEQLSFRDFREGRR